MPMNWDLLGLHWLTTKQNIRIKFEDSKIYSKLKFQIRQNHLVVLTLTYTDSSSFLELLFSYLPRISVILIPLMEHNFCLSSDDTDTKFNIFWLWTNAGWSGGGRNATSLLSIEITAAIVGLSTVSYCMHRSPICMHLKISLWWVTSYIAIY